MLEELDLRGRTSPVREMHRQVTQYVRNHVHRPSFVLKRIFEVVSVIFAWYESEPSAELFVLLETQNSSSFTQRTAV
jgi:hypothetical protein